MPPRFVSFAFFLSAIFALVSLVADSNSSLILGSVVVSLVILPLLVYHANKLKVWFVTRGTSSGSRRRVLFGQCVRGARKAHHSFIHSFCYSVLLTRLPNVAGVVCGNAGGLVRFAAVLHGHVWHTRHLQQGPHTRRVARTQQRVSHRRVRHTATTTVALQVHRCSYSIVSATDSTTHTTSGISCRQSDCYSRLWLSSTPITTKPANLAWTS